jgi:hypothetical protein
VQDTRSETSRSTELCPVIGFRPFESRSFPVAGPDCFYFPTLILADLRSSEPSAQREERGGKLTRPGQRYLYCQLRLEQSLLVLPRDAGASVPLRHDWCCPALS